MKGNSMYKRYYDGYPAQYQNIPSAETDQPETKPSEEPCEKKEENTESQTASLLPFKSKGGFNSDDFIIVALILLIVSQNSDDFTLPLILGALLIM